VARRGILDAPLNYTP